MGWTEETVRSHLQEKHEVEPGLLLTRLITEAEIEQAKGQKGLTRFLQKWREAKKAEDRRRAEEERKGRDSDWSVIGEGRGTPMGSSPETPVPSFPAPPPGLLGGQPRMEAREGTGLRIGAPQVYRTDRKAGAGEETRNPEEPMAQIAKAIQHQTAELATLVRNQQEVSAHPAGTLKGLGKGTEELVFLMRACGQYQIRLGEGEHGQALANALVAAQVGASSKLRTAGFRQKMTQRLAVGLAGGFWGVHERHCLGASEFVAFTDAELDAFSSEQRGQKAQEQRPQNPQKLDEWIVRVKRQTDVWCLVYGEEWRGVKANAMELLAEWHTALPHKWPLSVVMDIWEELHWRFMEEMKELVRLLKKEAARESMTLTEMRFHALLPGPDGQAWLHLPETFNIEKPGTWFQEEVIPRIERKQERLLWNLTWQGASRKAGPQPAGGDPGGGASAGSSQTETKPTLKNLWGPKLSTEEVTRAKERAPLDRNGTLLCWGNLCRIGCEASACQRSHEPLRGPFEALDECVRMQLLKRGGLKRMKAETKDTVTAKIKELRAHISKEKGDKIAEGRKGKGPKAGHEENEKETAERDQQEGGKAGGAEPQRRVRIWDVPEEFHVDYTKDEDLQTVVKGPQETWANDVFRPERSHGGRDGESATREAKDLVRVAQGLASQPTLKALQGASDDLYAWAAARVARNPQLDVETLMMEMSTYGLGELAKEAAEILEGCGGTRAGEVSRVIVRDTIWAPGQPGQGSVQVDGKVWRSWDYGEDVMMTEDLAALLQVAEPVMERRQCVTVTMASAILWRQHRRRPTVTEVHEKAKELRLEQTRLAQEANQVMGVAAEMVAPVEHELRVYAHDLVTPSHEKDFRSLSVFCLEEMAEARFTVLRADYRGGLVVESVQGQRWEPGGWDVWALIWKGHMTLIQPPEDLDTTSLWDQEEPLSTPAMGFGFFWHTRHDQPKTAPGRIVCRLCKPGRKAGEGIDQYIRQHSCLSQVAVMAGGGGSKEEVLRLLRPTTRATDKHNLVLQELFAGTGVITEEWKRNGIALPPIELYEEPHLRKGPRQDHDLSNPAIQARLLRDTQETDGPNAGWIASPCTSYCDWQLQNGGTRTFAKPEGTGTGPLAKSEAVGNVLSDFSARYFEAMLNAGGFPVAESSAPSGRYPKQWDLPRWKTILRREDVEWMDFPMCAFKLGPKDQPHHYYVHRTRVVFPRHAPLRRALQRTCPGLSPSHQHVALKGTREGTTVTRCTEAGAYAPEFVKVIVEVLQSSLVGSTIRGGAGFPTTQSEDEELEKLPCTRGPDGGDCGMCRACCQGKLQCRRCAKCREKGLFPKASYVKREEREQRLAGGNEEERMRGVWAPPQVDVGGRGGQSERSRSPIPARRNEEPSSSARRFAEEGTEDDGAGVALAEGAEVEDEIEGSCRTEDEITEGAEVIGLEDGAAQGGGTTGAGGNGAGAAGTERTEEGPEEGSHAAGREEDPEEEEDQEAEDPEVQEAEDPLVVAATLSLDP